MISRSWRPEDWSLDDDDLLDVWDRRRRVLQGAFAGLVLVLIASLVLGEPVSPTRTLQPTRTATATKTPKWKWIEESTQTPRPTSTRCPGGACPPLTHGPVTTSTPRPTPDRIEVDLHYPPGPFVPEITFVPPWPAALGVTPGSRVAMRGHSADGYSRIALAVTDGATSTPTRRPTSTRTKTPTFGFTRTATVTPTPGGPTPTPPDCFPPGSCGTPRPTVPRTATPTPLPTRWLVMVTWQRADGSSGTGTRGGNAGVGNWYWYFDPTNPELFVAVVNGCGVNGHFWVKMFGGTNVQTTVLVKDLTTGREVTYGNPADTLFRTVIDTGTFPCP